MTKTDGMKPNRQYFIVKINKEQQKLKREKIILGGSGYLGVRYSEQDYKGPGVLISGSEKDGPAYKAGFKAGDIIFSVNGQNVNTFEELVEEVAKYKPGEEIFLSCKNSLLITNDPQTKPVKLGEKKLELENPEQLRDMRHNLQFGELLDMGSDAAVSFPHAKKGDILLFHHSVEYKPRTENDNFYNDYHLIDHDKKGNEIRIVDYEYEVLGVLKMKPKPHIIPHPRWVFCHYQIQKASIQMDSKTGLWLPDQWHQTVEELNDKLEELKARIQEITSSTIMKERESESNYKELSLIRETVKLINQERKRLTKKIHSPRLVDVTVLFYNKESTAKLGYDLVAGDKVICDFHSLYPLDIMGVCYSLARVGSIEGVIFNKQASSNRKLPSMENNELFELFNPLHDRIVVLPFEQEVLSSGGIIIPDTADAKPGRGLIIAVGPGSDSKPMQAKKGDVILYNRHEGSEMEYNEVKFLSMLEGGIFTTLSKKEAEKAIKDNEAVIAKKKELAANEETKRLERQEETASETTEKGKLIEMP